MTEKLQLQKDRGHRAKRIYEDELVQEAFGAIERTLLEAFRNSEGDESVVRERAYLMLRLLGNFKDQFQLAMRTGDAAAKELLRIRDPSAWSKMFKR